MSKLSDKTRGGTTFYPLERVSLRWASFAWFLFRSRAGLWVFPASVQVVALLLGSLVVTGHFRAFLRTALSSMHHSSQLDEVAIVLTSVALLLLALAANTAMTAMANRAVRGVEISARDLFRFGGYGATSLALVTTLLAVAVGSLVFFAGALIACGLLLASQSAALRTGNFRASLRASVSVLRADPVRTLSLAAFLLLAIGIGFVTGGLGLLAAIPVAKIVGALADAFAEAQAVREPLAAAGLAPPMALAFVPQAVQFHWTADEEAMLRRTAPPPHLPHILAALMVVGLAAFLLFPRLPAATAGLPAAQQPVQPTAVTQTPTVTQIPTVTPGPTTPPVPTVASGATTPPVPAEPAATEPGFVESYGTENDPPLPCQMHWGNYTVRIEEIGSEDSVGGRQQRLTVIDTAGSPVYAITNERIGSVKLEPLLGGEQPELLVHTSEGGDGKTSMDLALTQQGGVHDIFLLHDENGVTPLHIDGEASEDVVVDAPLDGPSLDVHHYPTLTSTYKWNGAVFENATASSPGPTQDRIRQYEQILIEHSIGVDPAGNRDDSWAVPLETAGVGLIANAGLIGPTRIPGSVASTQGYRMGIAWLRENGPSRDRIENEIKAARGNLPIFTGSAITDESGLPDQSSQDQSSQDQSSQR